MKRSGFTLINLIILGIGILFIAACRRPDFIHALVFFTGIAFIIPGVINIFTLFLTENKKEKYDPETGKKEHRPSVWSRFVSWTVSIAAVVLGAMMCFTPETFRTPLIYIFAIFILVGGIYHIYMMLRGLRPVTFDLWTYIFPVAIIAISGVLFFLPSLRTPENQTTVALLTGISMITFAVTSFFESVGVRAYNKHTATSLPATTTHNSDNPDNNTPTIPDTTDTTD